VRRRGPRRKSSWPAVRSAPPPRASAPAGHQHVDLRAKLEIRGDVERRRDGRDPPVADVTRLGGERSSHPGASRDSSRAGRGRRPAKRRVNRARLLNFGDDRGVVTLHHRGVLGGMGPSGGVRPAWVGRPTPLIAVVRRHTAERGGGSRRRTGTGPNRRRESWAATTLTPNPLACPAGEGERNHGNRPRNRRIRGPCGPEGDHIGSPLRLRRPLLDAPSS
jgi:hypothetical protein